MKSFIKKSNSGFTLIELIIVVAIIAVLTSVVATTTYQVFATNAKQSINEVSSMLSSCRVSTLSGAVNPVFELSYVDGNVNATISSNGRKEQEQIATSAVTVSYTIDDGTVDGKTTTLDDNSDKLEIRYDSSGAIKEPTNIKSITVNSGSKIYVLTFTPQTGYHEVT